MSTVAVSGSGAPASSGPASSVKSLSAIGARSGVKGGDRQTTRSELRYGCFLPDLTGLARPPPIADLHGLYRVRGRWAQALAGGMTGATRAAKKLAMPLTAFMNVFAGNPLDRASYQRSDADWIKTKIADP